MLAAHHRVVNALATKDYLDTRFREFEARVEAAMIAVTIPVLQKLFG